MTKPPSKNQQTLVLIKPDGLKKSLTGNILTKLSETKLVIVGAKVVKVTRELAEQHYAQLKDQPFFPELIKYLQGNLHGHPYDRVLALAYYGPDAIVAVRKIVGATNPEEADPTTIRGAYGRINRSGLYENVIHASGNPEDAKREIQLWFKPDELVFDVYPSVPVTREIRERVWA